jgi:ornithine cyclodeaminase/alanine dehydrogenase-like protein (mu-crystallin family)
MPNMPVRTPLLFLSAEDVHRALPMHAAIEAMRLAFRQLADGQVCLPPRQHVEATGNDGTALVMTCHSTAQQLFSLKFITLFGNNRRKGLPLIQSIVMLADGTTGEPLVVMDGAALTSIRTGAASGAATDLLARPDAEEVAVFGAGVQARTQLEAICTVRRMRRGYVYDPDLNAAERMASEMSARLDRPITCVESPARAIEHADVVCTATTSSVPVFDDAGLKHGTHINAIGSFRPHVSEIPPATVCRAKIVVDHRASALEEAGDLLGPLRQGSLAGAQNWTELGDVLLGRSPGRVNPDEVTLFKSVGVAIQDLCAAACALENARRLQLGMPLPYGVLGALPPAALGD